MPQSDEIRTTIHSTPSGSSTSGGETPSGSPALQRSQSASAYSFIGVSIGQAQTRLASATTPAAEKDAAIRDGDGYFSLPICQEEPIEDPLGSGSSSDAAQQSSEPSESHQQIKTGKDFQLRASPNGKIPHYGAIRPPPSIRKSSSTTSLSFHRSISVASSLGDDTRFENVKDQINNRFKAIKDIFQDSNFRLPNLPSLPKIPSILQTVSKPSDQRPRRYTYDIGQRQAGLGEAASANTFLPLSGATMGPRTTLPTTYPHLTKAVEQIKGDVVILGGYRGSILKTAGNTETPYRRIWVPPISAALNITKVDLEVGLEDEDEEQMAERIIAGGMLTHFGPIDVCQRLFKRLKSSKNALTGNLRVHDYGYDWRLSPHRLSKELVAFLETLPCNSADQPPGQRGAIVIAHSLGGLITRHAVNQRPELFSGVVYAGTPQHCVNILGPLRNGDDVMWSSKILTAQVNFSVRTGFALLPLEGKCFIDIDTKKELPVDFFDPSDWVKYRFSPCIEPTTPQKNIPAKSSVMDSFFNIPRSVGGIMDNLPILGRRTYTKSPKSTSPDQANGSIDEKMAEASHLVPHTSTILPHQQSPPPPTTAISRQKALAYLTRTLASVKLFKQELAHQPALAATNAYPPLAVLYGKSEPTVCGARVHDGYEGIARADAYDSLVFASGDGVVLARAAMLPVGYKAAAGGVVGTDRGHISLLGDLEAVGKCLVAIIRARKKGVGVGVLRNGAGQGTGSVRLIGDEKKDNLSSLSH
jgi:hypothetical protein